MWARRFLITLMTRTTGLTSRVIVSSVHFSLPVRSAANAEVVRRVVTARLRTRVLMRMIFSFVIPRYGFSLHSGATAAMGARVGSELALSLRAGPSVEGQRGARDRRARRGGNHAHGGRGAASHGRSRLFRVETPVP